MIRLNFNSEIPIYQQLRNQIILSIAKGEVTSGEPLPTVRQLAEDLGINPMTVSKTYQILKQEGFVKSNLRQGMIISSEKEKNSHFLERQSEVLTLLIAESLLHGINKKEFLETVETIYDRLGGTL